jgi:hypothetical protein
MSQLAERDQSAHLRVEPLEDRTVPAVLDLTAAAASGEVGGALFAQFDGRTVERGQVDTFLRLHAHRGTTQGFNTSAPFKSFDASWNPRQTHAVRVADLPSVTVGGVTYRELVLDVHQPRHSPNVSLDELKLYVSNNPRLNGYNPRTGTLGGLSPVYSLDAGGDNWVTLNGRLNGGNGRGDALVYVPDALLAGGTYLSLYSKLGVNSSAQCGVVSWGFGKDGPLGGPVDPPPVQTASVSGVVFLDFNQDGVRDDGEPGVGGKVVWADTNNNGELDGDEVSTTTADDGSYTLGGITAGVETVIRSTQPDGFPTSGIFLTLDPGELRTGVDIPLSESSQQ